MVQECENPAVSSKEYRDWAGHHIWHGHDKNKGIGVFSRSGSSLAKLNWLDLGFQLFAPSVVDDKFNLLAVWTKNDDKFQYIGQLWNYLELHKDKLTQNPFVICGDFNSNKCWDKPSRNWNHSDLVAELTRLGATSVYHEHFRESHGEESHPTLFMQRNVKKPYHVDYAFVDRSLLHSGDVDVGCADEWLEYSDHMPLSFTIAQ